jgi:uncharacterized glyoxalase superfamily protein PhnB
MIIVLEKVIPVLRIFSVEKAKEFYVDFLGFTIDFEHRYGDNFPLFMGVSRGGLKLYLSEHHGDGSPGVNVTIVMRGLDALQAELIAKNYRYMKPQIEDTEHGERLLKVWDPFGNRLYFSERVTS